MNRRGTTGDDEDVRPAATRRQFLRYTELAGAAVVPTRLLPVMTAAAARGAASFAPLRPPATPLVVRSPYLSTWLAGDTLAGTWPTFWNGAVTGLTGIVRIDDAAYVFAGAPAEPANLPLLGQVSLALTATRSTFRFSGGGVELTAAFLSPVDPTDLRRQSVPMSYLTVTATSADGKPHRVAVYLDISGEWAHGDRAAHIAWAAQAVGPLHALTVAAAQPAVLAESNDQASWGTVVFAADAGPALSWQIADAATARANGARGPLPNTAEPGPKAIDDGWPVFAFSVDLGAVSGDPRQAVFALGHVRAPAVSYLGAALDPWWRSYWSDWQAMLQWFRADYPTAGQRAAELDARVASDAAHAIGADAAVGAQYGALCALALAQTFAATELVDLGGKPWALLKEISSDGNVSTVDVLYPAMPAFLYLAPDYLRLLLEPVLSYAAGPARPSARAAVAAAAPAGHWPQPFAPHDLGTHYPVAAGHNDGGGENMPVEESANMLIMSAALLARLDAAAATEFATTHYPTLRGWADYLVGNALDPGFQNQTDDFTGFIAHSSNLALKGIVGIGAFALLARAAGNTADETHYRGVAADYIRQWASKSMDSSGKHLKLAYDRDGTWSLKYNGYADRLLGLGLIPSALVDLEAAWYAANAAPYGVELDPRHSYTKADWELWTAGFVADHVEIRNMFVQRVFRFTNETPNRVPFTDWYDVNSGARVGFAARPVVGGVFSLLTLTAPTTPQP